MVIRPQPGPQTQFLTTPADIAIIGGGNDGGKTYALLIDSARHSSNPDFGAVFFRRETPQITHTGGLWEEATRLYGIGCRTVTSPRHKMTFASGSNVTFAHMEHESNRFDWDGAQIPGLYFDQLEQFTEKQFWHLLGRNRSNCGVRPYIRASCNPLPDSWLAQLLQWYWDPETGYAIKERSGVIRWFVRSEDGTLLWYDSKPDNLDAKSFTFILALIDDNKIALSKDPQRLSNLMALPYVERERRRYGNWKIKDITGDGLFKPDWWKLLPLEVWQAIQQKPTDTFRWARGWDPAGGQSKGSDYSSGGLVGHARDRQKDKRIIIADITRGQWSPFTRNEMMCTTARADEKFQPSNYFWKSRTPDMNSSILEGTAEFGFWAIHERGRKFQRAQRLAVQAEAGNVWIAPGIWNAAFIQEAAQFKDEDSDEVRKDDQVDCVCLADSQLFKWN